MILRRLITTGTQRQPVTLKTIARLVNNTAIPAEEREKKIVVTVATVTDDVRLFNVPKLTVAALRFTRSARARILKAGGRCLTLDQLALASPTGRHTLFLRGPTKCRKVYAHFGPAPGSKHSKTKPYILSKSRKGKREAGIRPKK
jgi:large subunit ribosomal protein L18e